ncbi:hypothetical protein H9Q69_001316 [Fusarium xylarioides]|uniref:Uncharacterized protein n=1 Tax=Fusarium xylarioides TaxID=221167 RepID=A0A9P7L908_9HYPO|nr:hypothetical protein H9Q70_007274 [Fusarium xylarioides]KAG5769966.1 hypothetical protein H9Q72_002961 [Fusarium xylarioides]KAG5799686.1 hypothetical protein H9Q69_001316 [Fusarium xylarioides]KAG5807013.1 hypothetical protein H9Q71_008411 [Fusarium xylarioides]KAG5821188.1 hypothetical protein H9Q74_008417 [Fusarium xylarioides]
MFNSSSSLVVSRGSTLPVCSEGGHVTCLNSHWAIGLPLQESKQQKIACDRRHQRTTTMHQQLDTEIRSVLELVRSSLRTNGIPLEDAIQELRRVTESAQNATDTRHPERFLGEKLGKDASEEKDQFRLEDTLSRL